MVSVHSFVSQTLSFITVFGPFTFQSARRINSIYINFFAFFLNNGLSQIRPVITVSPAENTVDLDAGIPISGGQTSGGLGCPFLTFVHTSSTANAPMIGPRSYVVPIDPVGLADNYLSIQVTPSGFRISGWIGVGFSGDMLL